MQKLSENIYVIEGPTNCGVIRDNDNQIYIIDSGNSSDDGKLILQELEKTFPGCKLNSIINTHSHADHAGGNAYLREKTGCRIFIQQHEKQLLENSRLHPSLIWGANPLPELCAGYLTIQENQATDIITEESVITLNNGITFSFTSLPGHYFEMYGITVKEKNGKTVFFAGDGLLGYRNINKYWISFLVDYREELKSLEKIKKIEADYYVPSHGVIKETIETTVEMNQIAIIATEKCILESLKEKPQSCEELLKTVSDKNNITLKTVQYALILSTLKSYLTVMYREGKVELFIEDNIMRWRLK